jgi:adenosylhomocysteine nucleosidase|tara:strand:- start:822 stop:1421 length:600 start_codon:yes stop_codon:yes gene_type:complete
MSRRIFVLCALPEESQGLVESYVPTIYTGVGKVNAAIAATKCIVEYNPDLILNFGTAGSHTIQKHTLVDCTKFIQRDMHIKELGFELGVTPYEDEDTSVLDFPNKNPINKMLTCGTGDTFVSDMEKIPCDVVDMEAYAIAKCCFQNGVDFVSFKYITDGADDDAANDWMENCKKGSTAFIQILQHYLEEKKDAQICEIH